MKTSKIIFPITLALIFLGTSNCSLFKKAAVDEAIVLKYEFSPQKDVQISSNVVSIINKELMGQISSADMSASNTLGFRVLSTENGVADMEMEFVEMVQSLESSEKSGDTDYSALIGEKAKFKLDGLGNISDLRGFDELPDVTNISGETINGDMYKTIASQIFFKLPDHPVKLGDNWTNKDSSDMPYGGGNLKTESSTLYVVVEKLEVDGKDCVKLDVTGKATTTGEFQQGGMDLSMDRTAISTGYVIFAINEGMFLSMQMESKTDDIIDIPVASIQIIQNIASSTAIDVKFE
jgi:hypothetical protein